VTIKSSARKVYLVRHGEARPGPDDAARPLTDRGREQVQRVARHAAPLGLRFAEIRHSGKLRAQQTAEILAGHLAPARGILETKGLGPGDDPAIAKAAIEAMSEPVILVGHLPHLARLASSLLVGDPGKELIRFSEAALACLGRDEAGWLLQWILTPEIARPS
jgi:phosphohistidine phosphatase